MTFPPFDIAEALPTDDGGMRVLVRLAPSDLPQHGVALIVAVAQRSFAEARADERTATEFRADDALTGDDVLAHLRYLEGHLHFSVRVLRGRMVNTLVHLDPEGRMVVSTTGRGQSARRWMDALQGRSHLRAVD